MSRLNKRVEDLERKAPEAKQPPTIERVIIGQNEAGEWVEQKVVRIGEDQ